MMSETRYEYNQEYNIIECTLGMIKVRGGLGSVVIQMYMHIYMKMCENIGKGINMWSF